VSRPTATTPHENTGRRAKPEPEAEAEAANVSLALLGRDRSPFLPAAFWHWDADAGADVRIDRERDPAAWHAVAAGETFVVTQWNDGATDGPDRARVPTCSCSMPATVRQMLDALDARPGMRILEVGTGTGYTAALLQDRVGPTGTVVSVEVDEHLAHTARANLTAAGVEVDVVTGDGLTGRGASAPFDRVHVTCGIRDVPAAWIEQARPGARIVMPWGGHYAPSHDLLLTLTVADDHTATGRFEDGLSYMKARGQRTTWPKAPGHWWDDDEATHGTSPMPAAWIEGALTGFGAPVIGFLLPNTTKTVEDEPAPGTTGDGRTLYLYRQGPTGLSCALVRFGDDTDTTTVALGPDNLATEFLNALRWWRHHGRPEAEGFGLTVTTNGERATQHVWFGEPDGPHWTHY
jgi:protein-L-isoaspartate(D-aspartate) O-methyltransferase